jgi:hypothetical protein
LKGNPRFAQVQGSTFDFSVAHKVQVEMDVFKASKLKKLTYKPGPLRGYYAFTGLKIWDVK